jgi:protein-disulfide isomerase
MKTLYWIAGIFVVAVGLIFIFSGSSASINPPLELNKVNPLDHVEGNASSSVVIIEYGDFQCPACRSYYPIVKQMAQEFSSQAAFVFRHYPLTSIHLNAEFGARAAEAAARQGKFWEMHNLLYEKQDEWSTKADFMPLFDSYAELVGIDKAKFDADFNSKEVKDFVRAERNYGNSIGIQGTPTFYINGKKIENPTSAEAFRLLINQALGI